MKRTFILLLVLLFASAAFSEELFLGILSPAKVNSNNIIIQNGSTPNLQVEFIEKRRAPESNLAEELERELIEIRATRICA